MRKIILAVTAALLVVVVFWGYLQFTGSASLPSADISNVQDLPTQPVDIMPEQIGEEIVKVRREGQYDIVGAMNSRYNIVDPQTKELRRVLGFEKLLNPASDSALWQVEKPYIEFYEPTYVCRMDSDRGLFTVNLTGGSAAPSDAQLEGNVVIHIQPRAESNMSETFIYLDDLVFSSERSEFSTNGPIRMISDQILLEGKGMILVFNTDTGRLEYLNIRDLDQLVLKNAVESETAIAASESPGLRQPSRVASADRQATRTIAPVGSEESSTSPASEIQDLYRCTLENNVLVRYGEQLVVAGAENVSVQNIRLGSSDVAISPSSSARRSPAPRGNTAASPSGQIELENIARARQEIPSNINPSQAQTDAAGKDVVVTCDGGIILQPMQDAASLQTTVQPLLKLQMTGAPLQVDHYASSQNQTRIHCGRLEYEPATDILNLFTNQRQRQITLDTQPSNNRIETQGNIAWDRKSGRANIKGPGKIYLAGRTLSGQPSEVAFQGAMDLLFSRLPEISSESAIEKINLTGGVDAVLKEDGWYKTSAQSAQLDFGPENMLTKAFLDGGVKFESLKADNPQRASSQSAEFKFGPENQIATAQMTGGVLFESRQEDKTSQAKAQEAVFYFDNSKIRKADLQGQVSFASDSGEMTAADATIDFTTNAAGIIQPGKVYTAGNAVLLAAVSSADEPPAKFEAQKIDYDLQSRSGLAHGPVRFTFYQKAEAASSSLEPWIPIVITADENAQFISNTAGDMERVVFNKNVLASRLFKSFTYTQQDQFHGDKLTVHLSPAEDGRRGVGQIEMTEGNVYAESIRTQNEVKLSHIKLTCTNINWNRQANTIVAKGPGQMELDNSRRQASGSAADVQSISQRPAFARVTGFETLNWDLAAQTLVVDGSKDTLQAAYVLLANDTPERFIFANSKRFEMTFTKNAAGKVVLKRVFSDQGITYRELNADQSKTLNEMVGQNLEYNPLDGGWLKIAGSPAVPCYLNGARVPSLFVNVDTGRIETSLSAMPSVYSK